MLFTTEMSFQEIEHMLVDADVQNEFQTNFEDKVLGEANDAMRTGYNMGVDPRIVKAVTSREEGYPRFTCCMCRAGNVRQDFLRPCQVKGCDKFLCNAMNTHGELKRTCRSLIFISNYC